MAHYYDDDENELARAAAKAQPAELREQATAAQQHLAEAGVMSAKDASALIGDLLTALEAAEAERDALLKALEPFATVGKMIDGPFGPALFADDDAAFSGGCAWTENGEKRTLTWGDFRHARATVKP